MFNFQESPQWLVILQSSNQNLKKTKQNRRLAYHWNFHCHSFVKSRTELR